MKRYNNLAPTVEDEDRDERFPEFLRMGCSWFTAHGGHKGYWRVASIRVEDEDN